MPIHRNDLLNSTIKTVITFISKDSPSMIVRFADGSEQTIQGDTIPMFIKKFSDSKHGIARIIGYELEEQLRHDFNFMF